MASSTDTNTDMVAGMETDPAAPLLEVDNLHLEFRIQDGIVKAVDGVSFDSVEKAVLKRVPKGTEDLNKRALKLGYDLVD